MLTRWRDKTGDDTGDETGNETGDEIWDETGDESKDSVHYELHDIFNGFNCYDMIEVMGDEEDLIDLHAIEHIIGEGRRKRRVKFPHERID